MTIGKPGSTTTPIPSQTDSLAKPESKVKPVTPDIENQTSQRSILSRSVTPKPAIPTINNLTKEKLATHLMEHMHNTWRERYQQDLLKEGKDIHTERQKPVPTNEKRTQEQLENEGFEGFSHNKEGKLTQNINQTPEKIVPHLHEQLNGTPANKYADILFESKNRNITTDTIEHMASAFHKVWMECNDNDWSRNEENEHLFVDYSKLLLD